MRITLKCARWKVMKCKRPQIGMANIMRMKSGFENMAGDCYQFTKRRTGCIFMPFMGLCGC